MTPERRAAIRRNHVPDYSPRPICQGCWHWAPCDTIELLDAHEASLKERQRADQRIRNQRHSLYWINHDHLLLVARYRVWASALQEIHDLALVCPDFPSCDDPACHSSYSSFSIARAALNWR